MKFFFVISNFFGLFVILVESQECGRPKIGTGFSVGSEYATKGQWPWLAPLIKKSDDKFYCGSSIISKRHLLSASHCFKDKRSSPRLEADDAYALIGRFNLSDSDESGATRADFVSIRIHPDWEPYSQTYDADIALVLLKQEIQFTKLVQPICLPTPGADVFEVDGTVAGYGLSDETDGDHEKTPKFVDIESVTQEVCLFSHEVISQISSVRMFCAGKRGKNPCRGDSGGGFYVKRGDFYVINGIVSASIHRECKENQFALFTSVPKFVTWVKTEMSKDGDYDDWKLTSLRCKYEDNKAEKRYECFEEFTFKSTTPNVRVADIQISFPDGKTYSDIDTLVIKAGKVTFIPDLTAAVKKFPNLTQFFIVFCGLRYVERSKLAKLTQLKILNFYGNEIEYFDPDVFDDLVNLEILAFVKNKVKTLPSNLVSKLINLKEIWSYSNPIEAIPAKFFVNNKKLEKAWLGNSKIRKIGFNFNTLPNLNLLDLRENVCIDEQGCSGCDFSITDVQKLIYDQC